MWTPSIPQNDSISRMNGSSSELRHTKLTLVRRVARAMPLRIRWLAMETTEDEWRPPHEIACAGAPRTSARRDNRSHRRSALTRTDEPWSGWRKRRLRGREERSRCLCKASGWDTHRTAEMHGHTAHRVQKFRLCPQQTASGLTRERAQVARNKKEDALRRSRWP